MRPSIACGSEQLDPAGAARRHTTAPISHTVVVNVVVASVVFHLSFLLVLYCRAALGRHHEYQRKMRNKQVSRPDGYLQDHILSFPKMYIFGIFIID